MSHPVLLNHETQAIKNPPPTFQTVSRSRILGSSRHGRALLSTAPSSARTSAPSKQEQERNADGKDRPHYHTPGHPGGRRLRPWPRCCCLPLQQILQRAIHTSDKPLGRPRHQGRNRLVVNTARLIFTACVSLVPPSTGSHRRRTTPPESRPEVARQAMTVGGSYSVTSQVSLDVRRKIFTSSSIVMPTRIGPGDVLWFLIETETHVGSFSGVETYSKSSSIGRSIVMVFSTCIADPLFRPPRSPAARSASQMMPPG